MIDPELLAPFLRWGYRARWKVITISSAKPLGPADSVSTSSPPGPAGPDGPEVGRFESSRISVVELPLASGDAVSGRAVLRF